MYRRLHFCFFRCSECRGDLIFTINIFFVFLSISYLQDLGFLKFNVEYFFRLYLYYYFLSWFVLVFFELDINKRRFWVYWLKFLIVLSAATLLLVLIGYLGFQISPTMVFAILVCPIPFYGYYFLKD